MAEEEGLFFLFPSIDFQKYLVEEWHLEIQKKKIFFE